MPARMETPMLVVPAIFSNYWEVVGINILPGPPSQIVVSWNWGTSGALHPRSITVDATLYMERVPDANKTFYENIKTMVYQILKDKQQIPKEAFVT